MFFNENLEDIIFNRHRIIDSDELVVIAGYLGPGPVERIKELPFKAKTVYGMFKAGGIKPALHTQFVELHNEIDNLEIYYSPTPVHAKCYIWRKERIIQHALVGSANFTSNGLRIPFREILAEITRDTFKPLNQYCNNILEKSFPCLDHVEKTGGEKVPVQNATESPSPEICRMTWLDRKGETQNAHGINWGLGRGHTTPDDGCMPVRADHIRKHPLLFPEKQEIPHSENALGNPRRHNDWIDIIWDDGVRMTGLLEGVGNVGGRDAKYPKQMTSSPAKSVFGKYVRNRIGVGSGIKVEREDFERYGRTHIDVSLLSPDVYYLDFSVS